MPNTIQAKRLKSIRKQPKTGRMRRSRNGCLTCRHRHIKCDETLPVCRQCIKSKRECLQGKRLRFLKCTVVDPLKARKATSNSVPKSTVLSQFPKFKSPILPSTRQTLSYPNGIDFLDQSLTIHNAYNQNAFHNYCRWFEGHTAEELVKSDLDFQEKEEEKEGELTESSDSYIENSPCDYIAPNSSSNPYFCTATKTTDILINDISENISLLQRQVQDTKTQQLQPLDQSKPRLSMNSQEQSQSQDKSHPNETKQQPQKAIQTPITELPLEVKIFHDSNFNFEYFIKQLLCHTQKRTTEIASLFSIDHHGLISSQLKELNIKWETDNRGVKKSLTLINFNGYIDFLEFLESQAAATGCTEQLVAHFTIGLNIFNLAIKCGNMTLLSDNFVSKKGKMLIARTINKSTFQSYENLLNFFELLVLDMNRCLLAKTKFVLYLQECDFDFIIEKLLHRSLCHDLNYFLIDNLSILMKLVLFCGIDLGTRTILRNYSNVNTYNDFNLYDVILKLKNLQQNKIFVMYLPIIDFSTNNVYFPNLNLQRISLLYNFIIYFITTHFELSEYLKATLSQDSDVSYLIKFWNKYEPDPVQRFQKLVTESTNQFKSEENIITFFYSYA